MLNVSKALIIGAVAILSTSTVSAQDDNIVSFEYQRALSVEANYKAFAQTAKRACDTSISALNSFRAQKLCRTSLVAEAVAATKVGNFITYHQSRESQVQIASARR